MNAPPSNESLRAHAEAEALRTRDLCSRSAFVAGDARLVAKPKLPRGAKPASKPKGRPA